MDNNNNNNHDHNSSNNNDNNVDDGGVRINDLYLFNRKLLQQLTKSANRENKHLMDNCIKLRQQFNTKMSDNNKTSIQLYNITYKNRKSKIIDLWNKIDSNIKIFWDENTEPDPSPYKQVFITLEDGSKVKHPIHYLRGSKTNFYNQKYIGTISRNRFGTML